MRTIKIELELDSDYEAMQTLIKNWEEGAIGFFNGHMSYSGDTASYVAIDPPEGGFGVSSPNNEHCKSCNERSEYEDRNGITDERVGDKMADIIEGALEDIKLADLDTSELQTEILGTLNEIYAPGADRYALFPYEEIADAIGEHPKDVDNFFREFDVKDWVAK